MSYRIPRDWYFLKMASLVSERATCVRRKVGCVLVNSKGHVIATGYNGGASGQEHCIDNPCKGADFKSGEGLDVCNAIHAEQNALLQCKDVYDIEYVYCTLSPCIHCLKLLLNTSAKHIVFGEKYVDSDTLGDYWMKHGQADGRSWAYINKKVLIDKCSSSLN
ncbi:MAG: deoxycytidylate deaminase [Minisyncoccia bacterium]